MEFFFKLKRPNNNYSIISKKENNTKGINIQNNLKDKILNMTDNQKYYSFLFKIYYNKTLFLFKLLKININDCYSINTKNGYEYNIYRLINDLSTHIDVGNVNVIKEKVNFIIHDKSNPIFYEYIKYFTNKNELLHNTTLKIFKYLFDFLNKGGGFYLIINNFLVYELYYILSLMFDSITIFFQRIIICHNFNPIIKKEDIDNFMFYETHTTNIYGNEKYEVLKNQILKNANIQPKFKLNELKKYVDFNMNYYNDMLKNILILNENKLILKHSYLLFNSFEYYNNKLYNNFKIYYNLSLINNFKIIILNKKIIKIHGIQYDDGVYLRNLIKTNNIKKCIQIGFGYGIFALHILLLKKVKLISIDENEIVKYDNIGIKLLKYHELHKRHKLYLEKSYECLPIILKKYNKNKFNLVFIELYESFHYSLLNIFYSNLLLKIGGYIIINDALNDNIKKVINYMIANYKYLKHIDSPITLAIFQKIN